MTPGAAVGALAQAVELKVTKVEQHTISSMYRAANELRNCELRVLANPSPSAPGSPPGVRSGDLRRNWTIFTSGSGESGSFGIESAMNYAGYLEHGTSRMAARPYVDKIQEAAMPKIREIFAEIGG